MAVGIVYTGALANGSSFAAGSGSGLWDTTKASIIIPAQLTLTGNYGTGSSNGDPLNFGSVAPPIGGSLYDDAPWWWSLEELAVAGSVLTGYEFKYLPGPTLAKPTQAGGVLQALLAGVQYTPSAAYGGALPSGTVINGVFVFTRSGA
jgi:hypothetical protein